MASDRGDCVSGVPVAYAAGFVDVVWHDDVLAVLGGASVAGYCGGGGCGVYGDFAGGCGVVGVEDSSGASLADNFLWRVHATTSDRSNRCLLFIFGFRGNTAFTSERGAAAVDLVERSRN